MRVGEENRALLAVAASRGDPGRGDRGSQLAEIAHGLGTARGVVAGRSRWCVVCEVCRHGGRAVSG